MPDVIPPACILCASKDHRRLYACGPYSLSRCDPCGLVFTDPVQGFRPEQEYDAAFFKGDGSKHGYPDYEKDKGIIQHNFHVLMDYLEKRVRKGTCLEIGSAFGFFLQVLETRGWKAIGYEVSPHAAHIAREKYGVVVRTSDFLTDDIRESFDLVCFLDTIEHLVNPPAYLARAVSTMKPGAYMVLTTGNVESLAARVLGRHWRLIIPPLHLFYFSPATIRRLLEKHGLRVVSIKHFGRYFTTDSIVNFITNSRIRRFPRFRLYINFYDVMTVVAKKP